MKKSLYEQLTNEELIKKRKSFKGVSIGFGIVFLLALGTLIFLLAMKGFKNFPFAAFIPFMVMPVTFLPLIINLNLINKEIKSRNL